MKPPKNRLYNLYLIEITNIYLKISMNDIQVVKIVDALH